MSYRRIGVGRYTLDRDATPMELEIMRLDGQPLQAPVETLTGSCSSTRSKTADQCFGFAVFFV
ncbi:MAG: hypothetical protein CME86_15160 [Herbaspirillum sp.]|nr:hypothetical protein [Herbaspirillum sp.]MBO16117.1 hypothetical protein [Herbaspirillum sp.]